MATKKSGQGGDAHTDPDKDLYEVIRDQLIAEIESGRAYPAGAFLPSIRELTVERTISTTTARRVLSELASAGYARAQGTRGYVSLGPRAMHETAESEREVQASGDATGGADWLGPGHHSAEQTGPLVVREQQNVSLRGGITPEGVYVNVRTERAPAEVARALRLDAGSPEVVVRRRVMRDTEGTPVELRTSYVIPEVADGTQLADPEAITESWHTALSVTTGRRPTLTGRTISARHPTDSECAALYLTPTACVLVRIEITSDQTGTPIDYSATVWPGENVTISAMGELDAEDAG